MRHIEGLLIGSSLDSFQTCPRAFHYLNGVAHSEHLPFTKSATCHGMRSREARARAAWRSFTANRKTLDFSKLADFFVSRQPRIGRMVQYRKSVACIIATNVSPPDAQPLFANGLMRAGLARVVSCFPYRGVLRSRKHR